MQIYLLHAVVKETQFFKILVFPNNSNYKCNNLIQIKFNNNNYNK